MDNIKLIGILAVILGHMNSPLSTFIFSWHMPLFFMISGFFLKLNSSPGEFIKKDFRRLMVPYFLFAVIGLGVELIKRLVLHREQLSLVDGLKGILIEMNYEGLQSHYGFVLWFLPTLFLSRLAIYFLYRHRYQSHLFSAAIVGAMFALSFFIRLPFAIDHAMNAMIWVWLGFVLFPVFQKKIAPTISLGVAALLILYGVFAAVPSMNLAEKFYGNIPVNIVWALLVIGVMVFSINRGCKAYFKNWSKETMLLFVFHPYTNNAAHLIVERFAPAHWELKLLISLLMLQMLLVMKQRFNNEGVFKYV